MYPKLAGLSALGVCGAAIISISGCAMHVLADPQMPRIDSITQPALRTFMASGRTPSIVLRVPAPQRAVTQAGDLNQTYNAIEKELVRAGFTVRDRGLLEEVLRSSQNLDYRLIQSKINAQLILEIVSISAHHYDTRDYVRVDNHAAGQLQNAVFPIGGWQFECKVILVDSGEVGGIYTIDVAPAQNHFVVAGSNVFDATPGGQADKAHVGYGAPLESTAGPFVHRLIADLNGSDPQGRVYMDGTGRVTGAPSTGATSVSTPETAAIPSSPDPITAQKPKRGK